MRKITALILGLALVATATAGYNPNNPNGQTTAVNSQPVVLASDQALPLPANASKEAGGNLATLVTNTTGVATAANQATANTSLASIATNTSSNATAANQATANTSLASIATNTANHAVTVTAGGSTSTQIGSTITTHLTFQSILASSGARKGCFLVNTSADKMFVYFGTTGSATTTNSIPLVAGQSISCGIPGGGVLTDNVAVTSNVTDGATYVLVSQ